MGSRECTITLSPREAGPPTERILLFHLLVEGKLLAGNRGLSPAESRSVRELSRRFGALFERRGVPQTAANELKRLGGELFDLFFSRDWQKIAARVPTGALRAPCGSC